MINPIKDIAGMIGAKIQNAMVNRQLAQKLTDKIGPEGVVGMKNLKTHYDTISNLIDQNKQEEAYKYATDQAAKVRSQQQLQRVQRTTKL